jgi:hypothetical protein
MGRTFEGSRAIEVFKKVVAEFSVRAAEDLRVLEFFLRDCHEVMFGSFVSADFRWAMADSMSCRTFNRGFSFSETTFAVVDRMNRIDGIRSKSW